MREKVEQESKLGDFEIQSIKLLAFRRAVAGVVHQPAPSLPPPPSSPPPPRARPPTSLVHSLLRPFFRVVLFPFLPLSNRGEAPPLKCIPMYHRPTTFAHSTLEICTCAQTTASACASLRRDFDLLSHLLLLPFPLSPPSPATPSRPPAPLPPNTTRRTGGTGRAYEEPRHTTVGDSTTFY